MRFTGLLLAMAAAAHAQTAELAVVNTRIYTVNPKQPRASALAARQGVITAIGDDVSRFIGPSAKVIDAHGATLIPGLIDSHGHVRGLGTLLEELDLRGVASEREIADRIRAKAKT